MASKLKPNATIAEINKFLSQLRISNFYVHPRLVEFNDSNDRQRKIILLCNKLIAKGLPKAVAQAQSEELADADTISVGIKSLKQTGSVLMLAGLEEKDLQQRLPAEASTHVMLVFLKEKKLYIYDPNFEATVPRELTEEEKEKMAAEKRNKKDWRPRLSEISSGARLRNLYKGIKGKFTVDEIWMGGGGNPDIQCLEMCQDQLELMENGDDEALNFAWAEEQLRK